MEFINKLSMRTRFITGAALLLMLYGFICRFGIYFFWESSWVGVLLLISALISALHDRIQLKRAKAQSTLSEKIFIGLTAFVILLFTIIFGLLSGSTPDKVARKYLDSDQRLDSLVGTPRSYSIKPSGGIQQSTGPEGSYGNAELNYIIKGKKFIDAKLKVVKNIDTTAWLITYHNY